ncbi:host attachment protein [Allochromatium vinosum]|uniref:Host attachment protein n=1 Tax=Allochromatium vinosum (strain ATCC 17899 / DSM 180 / NBRC 103801 / NCIMB 10441 / D) TaxID=572477 RepID=D3RNQ4_ALLVD|nr:host attachment protein [Allochromatium vinosum]ADC63419.1 Host attachment protein [Allochromatium vinosum DSM 180]
MPTWILVADNSRARLFAAEKPADPLIEISTLAFPEGRLHEGDLTTDKAGRGQALGAGAHGVNGEEGHKQENAERFASLIRDDLEAARNQGRFGKLYIIASPALLGLLRKQLSAPLRQLVAGELDKNLTTQTPEAIRRHLPDFL